MQYSIVNLKKLCLMSKEFRLDADYFKPKYLKEDERITHIKNIKIGEFCHVTDGQHGYHEVDEESPIFLLTAKNAKRWFADTDGADRLAKWVDDNNKRSSLKEGDLILSTRGTVGLCSLVTKDSLPANIDQDVARITVKEKGIIEAEFLLSYLNSEFGQDWMIRNTSGMVQQGLPLDKVRNIPIPLFSCNFQRCSKQIIGYGYELQKKSESLYNHSESLILSELGLADWKPKHRLNFVKNFSETDKAGRIDAEYYQPKYEEIEEAIKKYPGGYSLAKNEFKQNKSSLIIDVNKLYRYVEIGSVNVSNGEIIPSEVLGSELPANAKRVLKMNDIIVSKVRPYRGAITIVEEDGCVGSGAFAVLRENGRINKETLLSFLHSPPLLAWSLKPNTGTSYPVIIDEDILNLPIPLLPAEIQTKIKNNITESFALRHRSKNLLACAKRAVEIAIEKGEPAAIKWLENETDTSET